MKHVLYVSVDFKVNNFFEYFEQQLSLYQVARRLSDGGLWREIVPNEMRSKSPETKGPSNISCCSSIITSSR